MIPERSTVRAALSFQPPHNLCYTAESRLRLDPDSLVRLLQASPLLHLPTYSIFRRLL
jgi:hypothetical protein